MLLHACNGGGDDAPKFETNAPLTWSSIATQALIDVDPLSPMEESRAYAMAFTAMHDALNAIDRRYAPYLSDVHAPDADPEAAVAAAVHGVMAAVLPTESQTLGDAYETALFNVPSIAAFRAPPPYSVQSQAYADDFNEMKALGSINSSVRTAELSEIAKFWLESTPQSMTRIAGILAEARKFNAWDQPRLIALLHLAEADASDQRLVRRGTATCQNRPLPAPLEPSA